MKYVRKFPTRRALADHERTLDNKGWYTLEQVSETPVTGIDPEYYATLDLLTDDVLSESAYVYFKVGTSSSFVYYRKISTYMLWMVDAYYTPDDSAQASLINTLGYYPPTSIASEGDFSISDFSEDFYVPTLSTGYEWTELQSAPSGYSFMTNYQYLQLKDQQSVPSYVEWDGTNTGANLPSSVTSHSPKYFRKGSSAPYTYYILSGEEDFCDSIQDVTPAVTNDYPYMVASKKYVNGQAQTGRFYYRKDVAST